MPGFAYSVLGILAIIVHSIISKKDMFPGKFSELSKARKQYCLFMWGILAYYVSDSLWGIFDGFGWLTALKVDTFIYYVTMLVAVVLWNDYVVAYAQSNSHFSKVFSYIGRILVVFEFIALVINIFYPIFFWFDAEGNYHASMVRYIALYAQIVIFAVSGVQSVIESSISTGTLRRRNRAIGLFAVSMCVAITAQISFPLLPIYSLGYMIGVCFLHVYVGEDEKEEYLNDLKSRMDVISSMSGVYFCSYYVDLKNRTFVELDNKIPENADFIGREGDAVEALDKMCKHLVLPQYFKEIQEFTNLDTLDERMKEKKYYISAQFESLHLGWAEGYFIAGDKDENGKLLHVIWALRTIVDEKAKEEKLFYNSYIDELTGLYNRKMYGEDAAENLETLVKEDFVLISMDVNGLKVVNDSKGHMAGDELIKGAATCMKDIMGPFGRVYRTGGDEFIALINANDAQLEKIKVDFEKATAEFKGKFIDTISVSSGYVAKRENPELSFEEIEKLADNNMYKAKRHHYTSNGGDRRVQAQNGLKALCARYTKILMINLTEDKYSIISMNAEEQGDNKGFSEGIFEWLEQFAKTGQVHPDDVEEYMAKTNKDFLCEYFKKTSEMLTIPYRRKFEDEYMPTVMEMLPSENYSDDNQNLYLYVHKGQNV